jgi:ketosteroid isomerase-like protein
VIEQSLAEAEVKQVVDDWYRALDVHAPVEQLLPMLADDGLEMRFPEATVRGHEGFKGWYHAVTNRFFDEVHTMQQLDIQPNAEEAKVKLVVNWQAHIWEPPAPKSKWLGFDAAQTWVMRRSPQTQKPVIVTYIVDGLTPMPGSATL